MNLTSSLAVIVQDYAQQTVEAAKAEAEHKRVRAKRFLTALHEGEAKSAAMADNIADADDAVADLLSRRLITAALAEATKQKIYSLREAIGMERTEMANQRAADEMHARDRAVA